MVRDSISILITLCSPLFQVLQSLFWLVAFFWHFARAALVLVLDSDLKDTILNTLSCSRPGSTGCCGFSTLYESAPEDDWKTYSPHRSWVLEQSLIQQRHLEASQIAAKQQKRPLESQLDLESEVPLVTPSSWEPRELQSLPAKYVTVPAYESRSSPRECARVVKSSEEHQPLGGARLA